MKVLTVQDISCYGQCSLTVALPVLSSQGIETAILPSAILSTHTSGFKNFTVFDLTSEMPKIINHWINEKIKFNALYTGYIGDEKQFDYIINIKEKLLTDDGLFIVDPAMADNGKLYPALNESIIQGMKKISSIADLIIPNITEACFLTNNKYLETYNEEYIDKLLNDLINLGSKKVVLTGVSYEEGKIGAVYYDGINKKQYFSTKISKSYHGTGDLFSSMLIANILNKKTIDESLKNSVEFIIDCIKETMDDENHNYGVKFEKILKEGKFYDNN